MTTRRYKDAGVSLIEMLVVLVLFAVVAGAVVMVLPNSQRATSAEAAARALAAHLGRAMDLALTTNAGFGIMNDGASITFVQRRSDATWEPHSDNQLAQVKLSVRTSRISVHAQEVFSVSARLIPENTTPFHATFGSGPGMQMVVFDGARVRVQGGP